MLASETFDISRTGKDDWFDIILDVDTKLFVDPFTIFKEPEGFWAGAHDKVIDHFNSVFRLVAASGLDKRRDEYQKALSCLQFKEPFELCLGYTGKGRRGAGSSGQLASNMADAIAEAIGLEVTNVDHFEEITFMRKGIGADRISDTVCTILKPELVEYTQKIAERHDIPTKPHKLYAAGIDSDSGSFLSKEVDVPTNPLDDGPLLFVPARFLRYLPTLRLEAWWSDSEIREAFGNEVMRHLNKDEIIAKAKEKPHLIKEWQKKREQEQAEPYELTRDRRGLILWAGVTAQYVRDNPLDLQAPERPSGVCKVLNDIVEQFRAFVETGGGAKLLWDQSKEKPQTALEGAFHGIARSYCDAIQMSFDPRINFSRHPVVFTLPAGSAFVARFEVKSLHNGSFWNRIDSHLDRYATDDRCDGVWLVAVRLRDGQKWDRRQQEIREKVRAAKNLPGKVKLIIIDARR